MSDESPPTYRRGVVKAFWYWLSSTALWVGFRTCYGLRFNAGETTPMSGPVVLLANHTSHFDPPLIASATRRQLSFLARDTLFNGAFGWLIRSYDAVPVDRDGSGLSGIRATLKRLKQGGAVLLFPEGTRSPDGALQPFKPGFVSLLRRTRATLVPVGIAGAHSVWPRGTGRPRLTGRVAIHFGSAVSPAELAALEDDALVDLASQRVAACVDAAARLREAR